MTNENYKKAYVISSSKFIREDVTINISKVCLDSIEMTRYISLGFLFYIF